MGKRRYNNNVDELWTNDAITILKGHYGYMT